MQPIRWKSIKRLLDIDSVPSIGLIDRRWINTFYALDYALSLPSCHVNHDLGNLSSTKPLVGPITAGDGSQHSYARIEGVIVVDGSWLDGSRWLTVMHCVAMQHSFVWHMASRQLGLCNLWGSLFNYERALCILGIGRCHMDSSLTKSGSRSSGL